MLARVARYDNALALGTTTAGRLVIKTRHCSPCFNRCGCLGGWGTRRKDASGREALALDIKSKSHGVRIAATSLWLRHVSLALTQRAKAALPNIPCLHTLEAARAIVHIWRVSWLA